MDLLEWQRKQQQERTAPLAARMRPRTLDEFMGQESIVGPGRLLRRAIQADQLTSLLFFGPPGTGKTTLARIIANTTKAHFIALNAVLSGVKDIRASVAEAQMRRDNNDRRTILFIDEVHRFNKAQQDALLPWVENGTVILIGATTENPYFEVNKALVSRSRVFQLKSLDEHALKGIVERALEEPERGYGGQSITIAPQALSHLLNVANGDARTLLNALELAIETTPLDEEGARHITLDVAEESIQRRAVLYDKEGDTHFDTISAFIKSIRGSDPDAALYWLARMIYAGEDPRYILRRLTILASEDVGLADPQAIVVMQACAAAFDRVGMPEGQFPLAQATLYLANAEKSNSTMGFFTALAAVQEEQEEEVPNHLKDPSRDKKGFGHGAGYLYPHAYREHWVAQQYLPGSLQGKQFYQPSTQGWEGKLQTQIARRREAQLAAMLEGDTAPAEILTNSPTDRRTERWLQRTLGQMGTQLSHVRDTLFATSAPQRHHVVLIVGARSGLLTWEAVRHVPEGGVFAWTAASTDANALQEQSQALPELQRPVLLTSPPDDLLSTLDNDHAGVRFDRIIGRNTFSQWQQTRPAEPEAFCQMLASLLHPEGTIALAETLPGDAQRIYELVSPGALPKGLFDKWKTAEEAIYQQQHATLWQLDDLTTALQEAGLAHQCHTERQRTEVCLTPALFQRWFAKDGPATSYRQQLQETLSSMEVTAIEQAMRKQGQHRVVQWSSTIAWLHITPRS
jgi:putative ATPase